MKTFDEQLDDHLTAAKAGTLAPYEDQYEAAKASGKPFRVGVDARIGPVILYVTDAEIAQAKIDKAAEDASVAALPSDPLAVLTQAVKDKLGLTDADLVNAEATLKAALKAELAK